MEEKINAVVATRIPLVMFCVTAMKAIRVNGFNRAEVFCKPGSVLQLQPSDGTSRR